MNVNRTKLTRREAVGALAAGGLSLCGSGCTLISRKRAESLPPPKTPGEALERLKAGNQRFVAGNSLQPHMSSKWRHQLVEGQHPFAVLVACSDSRVPTELVFDQGFGDLFVIRNAGNVIATDVVGTIEYALLKLGVELVVVMGHEGCGAVTAALGAKETREKAPTELVEILQMIDPALENLPETADDAARLAAAVEANVRYSVRQLTELAAERDMAKELEFNFVGAVYSLETGAVNFLE